MVCKKIKIGRGKGLAKGLAKGPVKQENRRGKGLVKKENRRRKQAYKRACKRGGKGRAERGCKKEIGGGKTLVTGTWNEINTTNHTTKQQQRKQQH